MRYLVTGGAGFIGSNLVRYLLESDPEAHVTNLDALTYAGNLGSLADIEEDSRYTFVHGDICDADVVRPTMDGVDVVLNLAAESHVDRSILSAAPFVRTNVMGTQTLLAAALEVAHLVTGDDLHGSHQPRMPRRTPVNGRGRRRGRSGPAWLPWRLHGRAA